jgi:uncharacterized protein (DUF736 family)
MTLLLTLEQGPHAQRVQETSLERGELVIGRGADADWRIEDPDMFISRAHCTISGNEDGYFGNIRTLTLDAKLVILPAREAAAENAPDHRVFCDAAEVGAAWDRTGEKAGAYLTVVIDDPSFVQPIRASLFRSDAENDLWTLHWSRQAKREERT